MGRILIIKMSALGDVVLAMPHIGAIAAHHQRDTVHLLTGPAAAALFEGRDDLLVRPMHSSRRLGAQGRWAVGRWVRGQRFDRIYDLQGNSASRKLVRRSRTPLAVGTQPDPVYHRSAPGPWYRTIAQNAFERLNDTLAAGGVPAAVPATGMVPHEADTNRVAAWLAERGLAHGRYVVMHAGCNSRWKSKRWPAQHFVRLAQMLNDAGLATVWVGGKEDGEVNRTLAGEMGHDATGAFTLRQTYALADRARFAVSNDSCPMHLFALTGRPVFSFFGPTNWRWSHPAGQGDRVMRTDAPCSPCFRPVCPPERRHACMTEIFPERVMERIGREFSLAPNRGGEEGGA